jgi:BirA family biotin operon repressor/biotin-[acetyl-CoA-carboxylase] ligase
LCCSHHLRLFPEPRAGSGERGGGGIVVLTDRIRLVAETGSTNADLRALAIAGWPEGNWLRAERQTAGRGRLGREWQSLEGNLHASTLIRLRPTDPPVTGLGLLLGVSVQSALSDLLPHGAFQLKWPNDVMLSGAKLAGMLLEREGEWVIAGIGINVASAPPLADRETIALANVPGGESITAAQVLDALILSLDHWLMRWRAGGSAEIITAWENRAYPIGTRLTVKTGVDEPLIGQFLGLNADGALILSLDDGSQQVIHSGDVGVLA